MKIVTIDEMRQVERLSEAAGVSTDSLMERAGLAMARVALREMGAAAPGTVLALIGPGNNGADGLVAARHLQRWGTATTAYLCAARPADDPKLALAVQAGVNVTDGSKDPRRAALSRSIGEADLVMDAILGTGRARPIQPPLSELLHMVRQEKAQRPEMAVLALDLPTGLNADSGETDPATVTSDVTVTLGCPKIGLFRLPGAETVGRLTVADIGIPRHLTEDPALDMLTTSTVRRVLPRRPLNAHKGSFGKTLVVAGSERYIGAAYLACMGAARAGAGYVTLAPPAGIHPILAAKLTEVTFIPLPEPEAGQIAAEEAARLLCESAADYDVLLIGCGLGQQPATRELLRLLLLSEAPLGLPAVIDADGLNLLAGMPSWWEHLRTPTVVTPHPGEMARLLGCTIAEVEADRTETARAAAARWGVTVVLKGAFTVVAAPEGWVRLSPFANPALATAGTGDVLAGVITGLMAQGCEPFDAASAGVFLHAAAGHLVTADLGDAGVVASDLLRALPRARNAVLHGTFSGGVAEEP